jgi:2-polyprenyl-6-hydroxyphenyl methylase/3-demethylubiquinone-9 3-methyltransferase
MSVTPYQYRSAGPTFSSGYLAEPVEALLPPLSRESRVLDVGCGQGYWAARLQKTGCALVGIDPSESGIAVARQSVPSARFECASLDRDICKVLGEKPFDLVISIEVVEHVYSTPSWAACCFNALRPGGRLVCSTPYHGYLKNVALAASNRTDRHFQPLRDGGHIKFFSRATLSRLLREAGFDDIRFRGAGRVPYFWKSMVMSARRPG